ncbi:dynamin family protein [Treponema socranskii]|uniref:dynamin family protein n=1 Tax=Treponema socranskii TaxID=53419 RepID=UPI003D6E506C
METQFIEKLRKINSIADRYDDITGEIAGTVRTENGVNSADKMEQELAEISSTERLLNIGIIGRVKAGKSSLLNSLFFGGEQILPKAATPMTAALTVITYDENPHAEIEFFTPHDIAALEREREEFITLSKNKLEQELKKAHEDEKKNRIPFDKNRIERKVKADLKKHPKAASADQYDRMKNSGKLSDFSDGNGKPLLNVTGDKIEDLLKNLNKYVSADGEYMPFTKSVKLYMNFEELKDIQIVDTPGINDPIKSREKRTEDYLGECDVVFVVSSAGDFLSEEDLNLMGHVSGKKGVTQIFLVGSRSDQQLYGSEKEAENAVLPRVIKTIRGQLAAHAKEVCENRKKRHPESAEMYQSLIDDIDNRVLTTSAICHSMQLLFNNKDAWDEDMNYAWERLTETYPDYFSGNAALPNLDMLSGVSAVKQNIDTVRLKKDEIMQKRCQEYAEKQEKNVTGYLDSLKSALDENRDRLKNTDTVELQAQKDAKEKMRMSAASEVDGAFEDAVFNFKTDLSITLKQNSRGLFDEVGDFSSYERTETKTVSRMREKSGLVSGIARFFGNIFETDWGYESYDATETVRTLQTAPIKRKINDLAIALQDDLETCAEKAVMEWKGIVQRKTISALRQSFEDEDMIDIPLVKTSIRKVIGNMKIPEFKLTSVKFGDNYSGKLTDDKIDDFIVEVDEHIADLRATYVAQIKTFLSEMEASAKQETLSSLLFNNMDKELENLGKQIENKKSTLQRYNSCIKELSAIK